MVSSKDIWDRTTRRQKFMLGVGASILVAVLFFLVSNPQPEKIERVSIEGDYDLNGTETSFEVICGSGFEDNVLKSGQEYSFKCGEKLPEVMEHESNFGPLATLKLESINGRVVDSEGVLNPSTLEEGVYAGKQSFLLDSPERPGRYLLRMESVSDENRSDSRTLNISYYDEPRTQSFRFYSFEDLSSYNYRRSILILSSLVIVSIGLNLSSKLIEFSREN